MSSKQRGGKREMKTEAEIKQKIEELSKPADSLIVGEIRSTSIKILKWVLNETTKPKKKEKEIKIVTTAIELFWKLIMGKRGKKK